jgi:hypothetical protein
MMRRDFLGHVAMAALATNARTIQGSGSESSPESWRAMFPALKQEINGKPLAYLDTAATSLRPQPVIDAISSFYALDNANPGPRCTRSPAAPAPRWRGHARP